MNICLISPLPPPSGGIASWTIKYLNSEQAQENNVFLVDIGVVGKRRDKYSNKISLVTEIKRSRKILKELKKILVNNKIDIVHLNTACGRFGIIRDFLCARLAKKYNAKLVLHCHCDVSFKVSSELQKHYFKKIVQFSDVVLPLNIASKKYIEHMSNKKTIIIPNFLTNSELDIEKISINQNIKNILFVGHITYTKGVFEIFEIAHHFPKLQFNLAGLILDSKINNHSIPLNVKLLGHLPLIEIQYYMDQSDIFVFPTHTEGFPNVIIEAMAKGMPIISTKVGAIPEILEDNGGILIEPKNVNQLIDAIITFKNDFKLREMVSNFNYGKVRESYSQEVVLNQLFNIYNELLINLN